MTREQKRKLSLIHCIMLLAEYPYESKYFRLLFNKLKTMNMIELELAYEDLYENHKKGLV